MRIFKRIIPYLSLAIISITLFYVSTITSNLEIKDILINIFSNAVFFFIAYLFYDIIKQLIINNERKYLTNYIRNKIANDIFVALYFLKKIIHGYNLDTNTLKNIFGTINYTKNEIIISIKHQSYLGFQILKDLDELRSLFKSATDDNFILKYSSHIDTISLIRISNNLVRLESILKDENNFNKCAENAIEFITVNGREINPENDNRFLLLKRAKQNDRFVVYDSGYFNKQNTDKLLNQYVLKKDISETIAKLLLETFTLMKYWIPEAIQLSRIESRFRIIKDFFSTSTNIKTKDAKIYVADIIDLK